MRSQQTRGIGVTMIGRTTKERDRTNDEGREIRGFGDKG